MPAFDYTIQTPDAFTSVAQGFQLGSAMRAQQEQRAMQEQQAQAAMAAEQARQQELNRFGQLPMDKVTAQDVFRVAQYMPADKVTALKDMMGQMTQEGQKRELDFASGVSSAYLAGKPEVAKQALLSKAEAARNSGNEQRAQELESIAEIGMIRPEVGLKAMVPMIAQLPEGKQVIENIFAAQKITGEVRKVEAEATTAEAVAATELDKRKADIENTWSQMAERADRLALDRDRLQGEIESRLDERAAKLVELPESSRKIVNDSTGAAVTAEQSTGKLLGLADQLEQLGGGYGAFGRAAEWWARTTGTQDAMSSARTEYMRLRNSAALKDLPPGPATDKDVELALKGFPPETADAKYLASFIRGMAKISAREAAYESAKAEWVEGVGFMGKPKKDIEVDGVKVSAGTTFPKFAAQYVDRKVKETMGKKTVENRGYMKWATPQAAPATPSGLGSGTYGIGGQ